MGAEARSVVGEGREGREGKEGGVELHNYW